MLGNTAKAASQLLNLYFIAIYLKIDEYGLYSYYTLFLTYYAIFNLGTISGLNIELPYSVLGDDKNKPMVQVFTVNIFFIATFSVSIALFAIFYFVVDLPTLNHKIGYIYICIMCIMTQYEYFLTSVLRSLNKVKIIIKANLINTLLQLLSIFLIVKYGYFGLLTKLFFVQTFYLLYLVVNKEFNFEFQFNFNYFKDILKVGAPLYLLYYVLTFSFSYDKLFVKSNQDIEALGLYTYGVTPMLFYSIIQTTLISYFYPYFVEVVSDKNYNELWSRYNSIILKTFAIFLSLATVGFVLSPYLFYLAPKYISVLPIFRISLFSGVFLIINFASYNIVTILKDQKATILYHFIHLVFLVILPTVYFYFCTFDIYTLSWIVFTAYLIIFALSYLIIKRLVFKRSINDKTFLCNIKHRIQTIS